MSRHEHPFDWFRDDTAQPTRSALLDGLRDAVGHERYGHLTAVEAIMQALDGMPVDIDAEAKAAIKARLIAAGWSETAVDSLWSDRASRAALAAIEAAYAVAVDNARAEARQAAKDAGNG